MKTYIGMDAHSTTSTFTVLDCFGQIKCQVQVPTNETSVLGFVRSIEGPKALTFEETSISKWLYTLLKDEVDELLVCNVRYINKRVGQKNDPADSLHLAQQLRGGFLVPVFHEDNFFTELRSLVSGYEDVSRNLARLKCQYSALFVSSVVPVIGDRRKFYKNEGPLGDLKSEARRFVAENLFKEIQLLEGIKSGYVKRFEKNAKDHLEIKFLMGIPGIMEVRANTIAAIVCAPKRFRNKNRFWSYCMLVRHQRTSDGKNYGSTLTLGNKSLKNVFIGAAETVIMGESELKEYYQYFIDRGFDRKTARKALARKISAIALSVMRTKKPYDPKIILKEIDSRRLMLKEA